MWGFRSARRSVFYVNEAQCDHTVLVDFSHMMPAGDLIKTILITIAVRRPGSTRNGLVHAHGRRSNAWVFLFAPHQNTSAQFYTKTYLFQPTCLDTALYVPNKTYITPLIRIVRLCTAIPDQPPVVSTFERNCMCPIVFPPEA